MTQLEFISRYSDRWSNTFNMDLKNIRKKDRMDLFIDEVARELAKALPENIIYKGYYFDDSIESTNELYNTTTNAKNLKKNQMLINNKDTFARLAVYEFVMKNVEYRKDEEKIVQEKHVKMPIWIPQLIDDYHYLIKGSKYSAPLQIIDKIIYPSQKDRNFSIILKTMTRPIKLQKSKGSNITDIFGTKYITQTFVIDVSRKKIPFLLFYLAYFGFAGTLDFFGAKDHIKLVSIKNISHITPEMKEQFLYFKFGHFFLQVEKFGFEHNVQVRQFVASLLAVSKKSMDMEYISRIERWQICLGSYINEQKALEKGVGLVNTFKNALDARTKQLIKDLIPDGDKKQDMWSVVRWMFNDFTKLSSIKTIDITNKRLRLGEYLITPIIKNMQAKIYRYMNISKKNRNIKQLEDIAKIPPPVLLYAIIGKVNKKSDNGVAMNIVNFSSYVNDNALLNIALKATFAGPGSPSQKTGKHISAEHRQFDETAVGRICTTFASASDPGISVMLLPKSDKLDLDKMVFKE